MRAYTEYVFLTTLAFLLFIIYLVITVRSDSVDFDVNGIQVPNEAITDVYQLYIDENCASGNYSSFKYAGNFYSSTSKDILISSLTLPTTNAASGVIKVGYADTTVACGSIPTNPVIKYINSSPDIDSFLNLDVFIQVPATKYPFIYVSGFNYSGAALGTEY